MRTGSNPPEGMSMGGDFPQVPAELKEPALFVSDVNRDGELTGIALALLSIGCQGCLYV